ncbi:MAG: hypothetical protein WC891_08785 [Actinomycetota bacterium]|jgi:hypothetical protein
MIDIDEAKCLWNCGATLVSIAQIFGVSKQAIWQVVRSQGRNRRARIETLVNGVNFPSIASISLALGYASSESLYGVLTRAGYHIESQKTYRIVKNPPEGARP